MVTERRAKALKVMYLKRGMSLRDIAAHYQVSASTVQAWMVEAGITRRGPGAYPTAVDVVKLRELLDGGATLGRCSIEFQVAEVTLIRHLKRAGLYRPKATLAQSARAILLEAGADPEELDELENGEVIFND